MRTVSSTVDLSRAADIIHALQNILARSQAIIPDLETPYSRARFPITNSSAIELKDQTIIGTIVAERQQQLDAVLHQITDLETVMDNINNLQRQLSEHKEKIIQSVNLQRDLYRLSGACQLESYP